MEQRTFIVLLIGIAIGSIMTIIVSVSSEFTAEAERTNADIHEQAIIAIQNNPDNVWKTISSEVQEKIDEAIDENSNFLMEYVDQSVELESNNMKDIVSSLETKITKLENRVLILESKSVVTGTPTVKDQDVDIADFNLACLLGNGNFALGCEYGQTQPVWIKGDNLTKDTSLLWAVKDSSGKTLQQGSASLRVNSPFTFVWNQLGDEAKGQYTAIVEIDGKTDSIKFTIS